MAGGSEYLTSNAHIAYPFRENAIGLARGTEPTHGASATLSLGFLVDAVIMAPPTVGEVYLYSISDLGSDQYRFVFVDQNMNIVLQDDLDVSSLDAAAYYSEFAFDNPVTGLLSKFVAYTVEFLAYIGGVVTTDTYQLRLRLEEHTISRQQPDIKTFELYEELPAPPEPDVPGPISGDVLIYGGYNIDLPSAVSDTESDTTEIAMSALAGAGEGLVPCDEEESNFVKRFMHLVPDENGNIQLTPGDEDCYFIVPHKALQSYEIQGNCVACCSCEDYENTALALKRLLDRSSDVLATLNDAKINYYDVGVTYFNATIAPDYIGVKMQVNGIGGASYEKDPNIRSGSVNWGNVGIGIQNNGDDAADPTQLTINMTSPSGYRIRQVSWEYDGQGGQIPYTGSGPYVCNMAGLPEVARGKRLAVFVGMYWPGDVAVDPDWVGTILFKYNLLTDGGPVAEQLTSPVEFT